MASEHLQSSAHRPSSERQVRQHQLPLAPTVREALLRFVEIVGPMPAFRGIFVSDDPGELSVYTVIDSDVSDMTDRHAVYDAEIAATTGLPDVNLDFHLMNIRDYPGKSLSDILPSRLTAVWPVATGH